MNLDDIFPSNKTLFIGLGVAFALFLLSTIAKEIPWEVLIIIMAVTIGARVGIGVLAYNKFKAQEIPFLYNENAPIGGNNSFFEHQKREEERRKMVNQDYKTFIFTALVLLSIGLVLVKALFN